MNRHQVKYVSFALRKVVKMKISLFTVAAVAVMVTSGCGRNREDRLRLYNMERESLDRIQRDQETTWKRILEIKKLSADNKRLSESSLLKDEEKAILQDAEKANAECLEHYMAEYERLASEEKLQKQKAADAKKELDSLE